MEFCIVITGAGKGIGKAIVEQFVHTFKTGCLNFFPNLSSTQIQKIEAVKIIAISRDTRNLKKIQEEIQKEQALSSVSLIPYSIDISNRQGLESAVSFLKQQHAIHLLINNAAEFANTPLETLKLQDFERIFFINLFAPTLLINGLLPLFKLQGSHIINIGSIGGVQGSQKFPGFSI
jgi:short-subunit dehydrogenase